MIKQLDTETELKRLREEIEVLQEALGERCGELLTCREENIKLLGEVERLKHQLGVKEEA